MEVAMQKRVITREKLFSFKDSPVTEKTVFLTIREDSEPRIETEPGTLTKIGNSFSLSALLKISPDIRSINQMIGDGPESDIFPKEHAEKALQEAMKRIHPDMGRFEIVWVPYDGIPF